MSAALARGGAFARLSALLSRLFARSRNTVPVIDTRDLPERMRRDIGLIDAGGGRRGS